LRTALPAPRTDAPRALGCTLPGDEYQLPTALTELCLLERGWRAESLGQNLPAANLARAIAKERPRLAWVSVSHIENDEAFVAAIAELNAAAARGGAALVVGGRAVTAELRSRLRCASCCDNLAHLVCFAATQTDLAPELREANAVSG
jgi:MerR family transcriptional regulator, light-induced transcriptional regulator